MVAIVTTSLSVLFTFIAAIISAAGVGRTCSTYSEIREEDKYGATSSFATLTGYVYVLYSSLGVQTCTDITI